MLAQLSAIASIPSPGRSSLHVGPLELRAYGLMIGLAVVVAVLIAQRRWAARGGDPNDITALAVWAVPAGLVGARLYHVVTDLSRFEGRWWHIPAVWEGGLGIPGGIAAGVLAGVVVARRRALPVADLLDVVAPAIPVAQAIGRLGNWFNQELYGRPTDLPWALRIDPEHRPDGLAAVATYHPTFLYEAVWNLGLAAVLVLVDRHRHPRAGPALHRLRRRVCRGPVLGGGPPHRPGDRGARHAGQPVGQRRRLCRRRRSPRHSPPWPAPWSHERRRRCRGRVTGCRQRNPAPSWGGASPATVR